jgi:hypothetical protein
MRISASHFDGRIARSSAACDLALYDRESQVMVIHRSFQSRVDARLRILHRGALLRFQGRPSINADAARITRFKKAQQTRSEVP